MENVISFNNELSGLYENKPPISKAKMAAITRSAMRAIKFYKHVVQSVEKFILKCKPEYKVPGLYVIDSIVRQSRHQFGPEKDVFAPRFARNIKETFSNLFRCAPEDKSRIIRVLNLWQKNNVFAPEVIQPIFDLADPNHPIYQQPPGGASSGPSGSGGMADMSANSSNGMSLSAAEMNMSGGSGMAAGGSNDDNLGVLPDLKNNLKQLLNDPNVLRQLQTLQNFQKFKQEEKKHKLNEMRLQDEAFEKHIHNVLKASGPIGQDESDFNKEVQFVSEEKKIEVINLDGNDSRSPTPNRDRYKRRRNSRSRTRSRSKDRDRSGRDRDRDRRRRSGSRSRNSRSPRSNRRRAGGGGSRERERSERNRTDNRDKEKDREYERERRKKGLPEIRKEHLSVCSTTLWVGHLSKLVYQEELSDTFGEYGDIVSIDQIVPRGCAFIVMNRRQDAHKAMQVLKNHKLQGRAITISWAAGKGVKSKEWKDYWDLELGVTYIPFAKLDENTDMDSLEEGGMFDEDTMPPWLKNKLNHIGNIKDKGTVPEVIPQNMLFGIDTTQPPPGPPPTGGPMMPMVAGQFSMAPPMGPGPPRMLGPMGMPLQGLQMATNLVPGMPPPHPMMLPAGMLPPNFPPMPGQAGPAMDLGPAQFAAQAAGAPAMPPPGMGNNVSDDQMDIEMDDEEPGAPAPPQPQMPPMLNFNQPPPMFGPGGVNPGLPVNALTDGGVEVFSRDRNRAAGGGSRWGARGGVEEDADGGLARWRENFGNGAAANFNDGRNNGPPPRGAIPINILPLDLNNPPQRPDFMNEFENRGGNGPRGNGRMPPNHNTEFFAPMQNRFQQPTSLLQMRIPPPNSFNPRMGGPAGGQPMFMRGGQGGGGGGGSGGGGAGGSGGASGGRQQGAGGYFNPRNPFDRDNVRGGRGGGAGGGRANNRGNSGNRLGNWSDEEEDGNANNFKRRGPGGGGGGNRFRDRGDGGNSDERNSRDRGGRRGGGGGRQDRDNREAADDGGERNGRNGGPAGNRGIGLRDENSATASVEPPVAPGKKNNADESEDDWDKELEEYDARMAAENAARELDEHQQHNNNNRAANDVARPNANASEVSDARSPPATKARATVADASPPVAVAAVAQHEAAPMTTPATANDAPPVAAVPSREEHQSPVKILEVQELAAPVAIATAENGISSVSEPIAVAEGE